MFARRIPIVAVARATPSNSYRCTIQRCQPILSNTPARTLVTRSFRTVHRSSSIVPPSLLSLLPIRRFSSPIHPSRLVEEEAESPVQLARRDDWVKLYVVGGVILFTGLFYVHQYHNHPQHHELEHQAIALATADAVLMKELYGAGGVGLSVGSCFHTEWDHLNGAVHVHLLPSGTLGPGQLHVKGRRRVALPPPGQSPFKQSPSRPKTKDEEEKLIWFPGSTSSAAFRPSGSGPASPSPLEFDLEYVALIFPENGKSFFYDFERRRFISTEREGLPMITPSLIPGSKEHYLALPKAWYFLVSAICLGTVGFVLRPWIRGAPARRIGTALQQSIASNSDVRLRLGTVGYAPISVEYYSKTHPKKLFPSGWRDPQLKEDQDQLQQAWRVKTGTGPEKREGTVTVHSVRDSTVPSFTTKQWRIVEAKFTSPQQPPVPIRGLTIPHHDE